MMTQRLILQHHYRRITIRHARHEPILTIVPQQRRTKSSSPNHTSSNNIDTNETNDNNNNNNNNNDKTNISPHQKLRIAIAGSGAAGLSTALHLAPLAEKGYIHSPISIYESSPANKSRSDIAGAFGREIGVGVWNTALCPLTQSKRRSHEIVLNSILNHGRWVRDVGYRTPNGDWLARSKLAEGCATDQHDVDPALLFLSERDLLASLREGVEREESLGNVKMHYARDDEDKSTTVDFVNVDQYSQDNNIPGTAHLVFQDQSISEENFHLIVGCAGMRSPFRRKTMKRIMGEDKCGVEDRSYVVFRGNSPLRDEDLGVDGGISFQTWGEGQSMRFATVPLPNKGQVWFATIQIPKIENIENDPVRKEQLKKMLLEKFHTWHQPVTTLIESTPADSILIENAEAHKFSVPPVPSLHCDESKANVFPNHEVSTLERKRLQRHLDEVRGKGPILLFVGDASTTVDPVLAQGFNMAMEQGAALGAVLKECCWADEGQLNGAWNFHPEELRGKLNNQHMDVYEPRLLALLRATELVQVLAQPNSSIIGYFNKFFIRPVVKWMIPEVVKKGAFDYMVKYSLGMHNVSRKKSEKDPR